MMQKKVSTISKEACKYIFVYIAGKIYLQTIFAKLVILIS